MNPSTVRSQVSSRIPQPASTAGSKFTLTWYHWEEIQVFVVFLVLILFFSRSTLITVFLLGTTIAAVGGLYCVRLFSVILHRQELFRNVLLQYHEFRLFLGRESVHRSRVAMAFLSMLVLGVLASHRITLATQSPYYATPSDLYWILFLCWYFLVWSVSAGYCLWIWARAWEIPELHNSFMDGLVASNFFYHGFSRHNRIVTFVMGFLLGGVPSFFCSQLTVETPYGYWIASFLITPVVALSLGGAYYAMKLLYPKPVQ
jgi:hypothetical protein